MRNAQYLKYALGEIILVVIGILIALSINNWNEDRKKIEREQFFLSQLLDDALKDSIFYESRHRGISESVTSYDEIFRYAESGTWDTTRIREDRLFLLYAHESLLVQNHPNAIDLVSNQEIKELLQAYFGVHEYVVKGMSLYNRIIEDQFVPYQVKHYELLGFRNQNFIAKNYAKLLKSTDLPGLVYTFSGFATNGLEQVDSLIEINNNLIHKLRIELK